MSFRLFVYYCALCGGWAALGGWALGRLTTFDDPLVEASIKGLCLGLAVTLALSAVDGLLHLSLFRPAAFFVRVGVGVLVGSIGGMFGGLTGQVLFNRAPLGLFLIAGWTVTGLLIGMALGVYDLLVRFVYQEALAGAWPKLWHGLLGGAAGGLVGGSGYLLLRACFHGLFREKPLEQLWTPSGSGFVAVGLCIGLLIGLAQVLLKEAWVRVENGRRAGREMLLTRPATTIGRAESSDIGLFGDPGVEKTHACIVLRRHHYVLTDAGTTGGTFLNGQRLAQEMPLRTGDLIRVGDSLLRFGEKRIR